ncbi:trypsin-like peptidase domain-containing protein [Nanoarchaeota archaeon]
MDENELEDYIKTQKSLGVKDEDIVKSLLNAGYMEHHFKHILEKHKKQQKTAKSQWNISTRHVLALNFIMVIVFGLFFVYVTQDYNDKITLLKQQQDSDLESTTQQISAQQNSLNSLRSELTSTKDDLKEDITQTDAKIDSVEQDLKSSIQTYNYQSMNRDRQLSDSIQKANNRSLSTLSVFGEQLQEVKDASVDFTPIIPKSTRAVVNIGSKGSGYFNNAGSGVFINDKGYIVTNWHVIDELNKITVRTSEGTEYLASVVGKDEDHDVAVLKIPATKEFEYLDWANSDDAFVGQHVIAIGNPVGFESTVTEGIISNRKRLITGELNIYYIQTDVAINAGNSGGPLIDKEGDVIGIATLKYAKAGFEGLSFALRSNDVRRIVMEILQEEAGI